MVRELKESEISAFIDFGDRLNRNDPHYVPFIRRDLTETIRKLVFEQQDYKALISLDKAGAICGRILLTTGKNKQLTTEHCGYFSHLEVIEDFDVFIELMHCSEETLAAMGAEYLLGSFFPYDPDNRRGILVSGFELEPMIFTSHNLPYYGTFFERAGYAKLTDALEYAYRDSPGRIKIIHAMAESALKRNALTVDKVDLRHVERDIEDIHEIMVTASTEINFEAVPPVEELKQLFVGMKRYINPDFVFIVRKQSDGTPVGFTFSLPNYYELIRKMNGRLNLRGLFIFLFRRKKISGLRCMLQYVTPEYQSKGVLPILYSETKKSVDKYGIRQIALGTIMEKNDKSNRAVVSAGGELSRVYRLFYKKLD